MPSASLSKDSHRRNLWFDCGLLLTFILLVFWEFTSFLTSPSFGPEYAQFFAFNAGRSFKKMLPTYLQFDVGWYRPTQFWSPYWLGEQFIGWHDIYGWRVYELITVITVGFLIYRLVLLLLPGRRIAAFTAALYFTSVPTIYSPFYELSAFDFLHINFTLLCIVFFIQGYRSQRWRRAGWTFLALLSYIVALTCKEIAVVTPVYLVVLSAILYFYEPETGTPLKRILREAARLAPLWAMTGVYWFIHVRKIPPSSFSSSDAYRLSANWMLIIRNINKYPLWFARIYSYTLDSMDQAIGYQNLRNNLIGITALALVCYACFRLWRKGPEYQKYILAAIAWLIIFLMVPVYSGGYFWHGNLALCGYCLLFGASADWLAGRLHERKLRWAFVVFLVAGIVGLTRIDTAASLVSGLHAETYRINSTVLTEPPVPFDRVKGPALVYVEDRKDQGWWPFGAGSLFQLVYLNPQVNQVMVPLEEKISFRDCVRWLKEPNAFFFWIDDDYHWHDGTAQFREFAKGKASTKLVLPVITSIFPTETRAGVDFNVQKPAGISALGIEGSNFESGAEVLVNGKKQPTAVGKNFISILVPREFYSQPGNMSIQIRNSDGSDSEPYLFRVLK